MGHAAATPQFRNHKKMPLHHPIWKKEYCGPRMFAKSYKAWSLPLGLLRRGYHRKPFLGIWWWRLLQVRKLAASVARRYPFTKIPVFPFQITGVCSKIIPVLTQNQLFIFWGESSQQGASVSTRMFHGASLQQQGKPTNMTPQCAVPPCGVKGPPRTEERHFSS